MDFGSIQKRPMRQKYKLKSIWKRKSYLWKNRSPRSFMNTRISSLKKRRHDSPSFRHGTTRLKWRKILYWNPSKRIISHLRNKLNWTKFLKDNLDKGYIRPLQSPMASPFFFVDKKDGKLRTCQDYRYLNKHMIKTPIHFHWSANFWINSRELNS